MISGRASITCIFAAFLGAAVPTPAQTPDLSERSFRTYDEAPQSPRISNFSGMAVPRYSSLRADEVNGRAGPSLDYPVKWIYRRAGLPVIVVRESEDWRKIRDPMGDEVWVHKSLLAAERTVAAMRKGEIRRDPQARAPVVATFASGAVLSLDGCEGGWCQVEAEGKRGWALRDVLWGAGPVGGSSPAAPALRP